MPGTSSAVIRVRTATRATTAPTAKNNAASIAGREWVRNGGRGGRKALIKRFDDAVNAIPDSLSLAEPT
jgi:hypothetical protein